MGDNRWRRSRSVRRCQIDMHDFNNGLSHGFLLIVMDGKGFRGVEQAKGQVRLYCIFHVEEYSEWLVLSTDLKRWR